MHDIFKNIKKELMNDTIPTIIGLSIAFAIVSVSIALSVWLFSL